jgi:hypothetical protein
MAGFELSTEVKLNGSNIPKGGTMRFRLLDGTWRSSMAAHGQGGRLSTNRSQTRCLKGRPW